MKTTIVRTDPQNGRIYLRESLVLAFFLPHPIHDYVTAVRDAFDLYTQFVPPSALKWEIVGATAEEWKPVNATTYKRCRAQLEPERARKRNLTAFRIQDGVVGGDAPGNRAYFVGGQVDPGFPDETALFQMHFPCETVDDDKVEAFVSFVRRVAALLPYISGYASLGLSWTERMSPAAYESRALSARHAGYDLQNNDGARVRIGTRVRGARWLTLVGPVIVDKLGGADSLRAKLAPPITVEPVGKGWMIRAGVLPELGDTNRNERTPLLRAVAAVLEPVTWFHEVSMVGQYANQDLDVLEKFERRFFD